MEQVGATALRAAARHWISEQHLSNVLAGGEWTTMYDSDGHVLSGIRGKVGVGSVTLEDHPIGADLIEMQPGSAFALHEHPGDHILYVISGTGFVHISGVDRPVKGGDLVFIAAEHPHAVKGPPAGTELPLCIIAFGYPHKYVGASDRMHHPHTHD
jgi:quercetin dioxygenase-like cupin family protein